MSSKYHIGIVSVFFDSRPEGICTGRLIRALLDDGHKITLFTSSKSSLDYTHPKLTVRSYPSGFREFRSVTALWARLNGHIPNNYYQWGRKVADTVLRGAEVPDVFYGRAWPHASWVPAYELAEKYSRPLMLHLSDPFPPPNEPQPDQEFLKGVQKMVRRADVVTFTNQQTIPYQKKNISFDQTPTAVLPHVTRAPEVLSDVREEKQFYHIGAVSKFRPADPLLQGFALFLEQYPDATLNFVGASAKYLEPLIHHYKLEGRAIILPYTDNVLASMEKSSLLICLDANIDEPVFTPTKIIEYLTVNRPVLAITPPNSPVDMLVGRFPDSAVSITEYTAQAIANGLDVAEKLRPGMQSYQGRFAQMEGFSAQGVANTFYEIVASVLSNAESV
ncbi:hypothetical protein [Teredinibacter sp. KSP-S5-2]|uniref:hypothetical protein n=1 Tax=Teredinibacter sp. KSP-S5-2 TaxID=3034506 RepID=UPI00293491D5|nr:hypothetical protein [Teredinibacter sp. KSP-S5-2]WNO08123.1 hypothetical protein P5V12_14180 [Teredinibacter sp. KSP-S5-2]